MRDRQGDGPRPAQPVSEHEEDDQRPDIEPRTTARRLRPLADGRRGTPLLWLPDLILTPGGQAEHRDECHPALAQRPKGRFPAAGARQIGFKATATPGMGPSALVGGLVPDQARIRWSNWLQLSNAGRDGQCGRPKQRQIVSEPGDVLHDLPAFLTAPLYRRWHLHWGATPAEAAASLPGDSLLPRAQFKSTGPSRSTPRQHASGRGWCRSAACAPVSTATTCSTTSATPSATTIVPGLQHLEVGQWVPMSPAATPTDRTAFKIHSFRLNEWLLWTKPDSTWAWQLTPPPTAAPAS